MNIMVTYGKWRKVVDENESLKRRIAIQELQMGLRDNYAELIMAVETKTQGESRHQTALRYIKEAMRKRRRAELKKEMDDE